MVQIVTGKEPTCWGGKEGTRSQADRLVAHSIETRDELNVEDLYSVV